MKYGAMALLHFYTYINHSPIESIYITPLPHHATIMIYTQATTESCYAEKERKTVVMHKRTYFKEDH